jgi:Zn-dependent protease with chaperone function
MSEYRSEHGPPGALEGAAKGEWLGGETAETAPACLYIRGNELVVTDPPGLRVFATWPLDETRVNALHDGAVVHVECESDADRFVTTTDRAFVERVVAAGARRVGLPVGRRGAIVAVACAAAIAGIFAALYAAAPWLSRRAAERVPLEVERRLDAQTTALVGKSTCDTPDSNRVLGELLHRLDPAGTVHAQVRLVNLSVPNAFSLPGGAVLMTRGLVEQAKDVDEVEGVLAHELAHVAHRDVLAELIESTFMSAIWALTVGDYSGLLVVDPRTVQNLLSLRHSRDAETEADATAAELLEKASVSTGGLVAFFERSRLNMADRLAFLSTHPATADRLTRLRARAQVPTSPAFDAAMLGTLRRSCAGLERIESVSDLFR